MYSQAEVAAQVGVDLEVEVEVVLDSASKMTYGLISNVRKLLLPKLRLDAQSSSASRLRMQRRLTLLMDLTFQQRRMYQVIELTNQMMKYKKTKLTDLIWFAITRAESWNWKNLTSRQTSRMKTMIKITLKKKLVKPLLSRKIPAQRT